MEMVAFLKEIELFKDLDEQRLESLLALAEQETLAGAQALFRQSSPRHALYVLLKGEVALERRGPFGDPIRLGVFKAGDFLGEGALVDDDPHSTSAVALCDTALLAFPLDRLKTLFLADPSIHTALLARTARVMARRMRATSAVSQYASGRTRLEHDLLGDRDVPDEAYYGVQTLRALENFPITGIAIRRFPALISALAAVKMAAAQANAELGLLEAPIAQAIERACQELMDGKWHSQFVVDMIQGGAGTSTNMNANEVIANRALELLGHKKGDYKHCHPNNHVNLSQSTNDVYPTSLKLALTQTNESLTAELSRLIEAFRTKAREFAHIIKMGRTQLQDAVPMTLGQGFSAYATTLGEEVERLADNVRLFLEVNMGGTAIGTGINTDPRYAGKVVEALRRVTGRDIKLAPDLVEATQDTGAFVMYSSAIKRLAVKLSKISNDLRLLSSGPRAGFNEINLPPMQPGSSIMPGKVNPVIPEVVNQIAFKVIGNDLTVTLAAEAGQLELNVMEPIIVQSLFESTEMLISGMRTLRERCIAGITANEAVCRAHVQNSIGVVTALNPVLGYEAATKLAQEAYVTGRGIYELVLEHGLLSKEALDELLDPKNLIQPQVHARS